MNVYRLKKLKKKTFLILIVDHVKLFRETEQQKNDPSVPNTQSFHHLLQIITTKQRYF